MSDHDMETAPTIEWMRASTAALALDCESVSDVPQGFGTALRAFRDGVGMTESDDVWHAVEALVGILMPDYYGPVSDPISWIRDAAATLLAECDHAMVEMHAMSGAEEDAFRLPIQYGRVDRIERAHVALGEAIQQLKIHAASKAVV